MLRGMVKRSREPLAMRPGRPIVAAMFMVVLSFAGALVYLQLHLRPLTQGALTVVDHAAPSIEHLSEAQTELTRLGMFVERVRDAGRRRSGPSRAARSWRRAGS